MHDHSSVVKQAFTIRARLLLVTSGCIATGVLLALVYFVARYYVVQSAENRIRDALLQNRALHWYLQLEAHPVLSKLKAEKRVSEEFYAPELLSSTYITRTLFQHYNEERKQAGLSEVRYRLAALEPRNPVNAANEVERRLIERFNDDRSLREYREVRRGPDGQHYLYYAIPFIPIEERCLQCHGPSDSAPRELREYYDWQGGYDRKPGEIVAIETVSTPLHGEFHAAQALWAVFLCAVIMFGGLFFVNARLRGMIRNYTAALRGSEAELESIFKAAPVGIGLVKERVFMHVNDRMCVLTGYTREELLGRNARMIYPSQEDYEYVGRVKYGQVRERGVGNVETRWRRKDGTVIDILLSSCPLDPGDWLKGITFTALDITELKKSSTETARAKLLLEAVLDQSPVPMVVADSPDGTVRYANRAALDYLGIEDESSYLGLTIEQVQRRQTWKDILPDGTPVTLAELPLARALRGETTREAEYGVIRKDGTTRWEMVSGTPIYDRNGELTAGLVVFPDITERKQADEDRARLTAILENTSDLVSIATPDGRLRYLNSAGRRLLGWDETDSLSGRNIADAHRESVYRRIQDEAIPEAIRTGIWHGETNILNAQGAEIPVSQVVMAHRAPTGEVRYVSTIIRDITERKRTEEQLRANMEEIERFNVLAMGRENRIIELKQRVNELVAATGQSAPYDSTRDDESFAKVVNADYGAEAGPTVEEITANYDMQELLALEPMQRLLDSFCDAVGNAAAIIDLNGRILVGARWQRICTDFHRSNTTTCARCIESDTVLASLLQDGERFSLYQCRNGLTDAASPIVIEGRHVANVFVGQFLLEPANEALFRRQAEEFGFDETAYLEALRKVPIVPREKLSAMLSFLTGCAEMVASMGLERLRSRAAEANLARRAADLDHTNRELHRQRTAALSLAEDADEARTAAEQIQQALRESEERYRIVAEKTGQLIYDYNVPSGEIHWSGAIEEITGHAADEFQRVDITAWAELVHPDDRPRALLELENSVRRCGRYDIEYRFRRKDERYIHVEEHGIVLGDAENRAYRMLGTMSDVSERKRAEHAIQTAAREWRTTFDAVNDVIWLLDREFRIVRSNRAASRLFGAELADLLGRSYWEVVHRETGPIPGCPVTRMRETKSRETLELQLGNRWYDVAVDPILDDGGELTGAVYIISDITQRKNVELALQSRIVAMTRPLDDATTITFSDLFDLEEIQKLQDAFAASSGVAALITDPEGRPLTRPSRFCRLCSEFVRASEVGRQRCAQSDAELGRDCVAGPIVRPCLSAGLWGAGASIKVGGKHVANWLIGQVRNESLDLEQIGRFAEEIGADPEEFRRGLMEVPVMSEEQFRKHAHTLFILSQELSAKAYQNIQQARFIADLKRAEEERDRLFNSSIDLLCIAGFDGRLRQVNPAWTRALGWREEELTKTEWLEFTHPDDVPATIAANERLKRGEEVRSFENRYRCKDGSYRWLSWNSYPLPEQQLIFAVCRDVTEIKAAEEERVKLEAQLRQSQKMEAVGQLAGGVAHDFNNILTAILGNVDLAAHRLNETLPAERSLLEGMAQIERSAQRAAGLTRQLLAFSRRQVTQPANLNLNKVLADVEPMLRRLITENISLRIYPAQRLPSVRADAGQLEQVILNLVVNARDAMPEGGVLTIETLELVLDDSYVRLHPETLPGRYVSLTVTDSGIGMDAQTRERIFEPFFTTKPVGQGTGLGLATVYGIVKQSGGHIHVYSEPGRGSSFKLLLPAVTVAFESEQAQPISESVLTGTETILVAEDDPAVRELTERILRSAGYNVLSAGSGAHALRLLERPGAAVDLLITDVVMPDMNGRQLARAIADSHPRARVLYVSGYTANVIAHHGVLDEGIEFLEKPFTRRGLLSRVRQILDDESKP